MFSNDSQATEGARSIEQDKPPIDELQISVVVSELRKLSMSEEGARVAAQAAQQRGLTHTQVDELVELYRSHQANDPHMTVGWLHRWLTGRSQPPHKPVVAETPQPVLCGGRGDGLTREQIARERLRTSIIRNGRQAGVSEELIKQRCEEAGVDY